MINLVEVGMGAGQVLAKLGVCDTARGPVHLGNQISQSKMGNMEFVSYSLLILKIWIIIRSTWLGSDGPAQTRLRV